MWGNELTGTKNKNILFHVLFQLLVFMAAVLLPIFNSTLSVSPPEIILWFCLMPDVFAPPRSRLVNVVLIPWR